MEKHRRRQNCEDFSCLICAFGVFLPCNLPHNKCDTLAEILRWFRSEKCIAIKSLLIPPRLFFRKLTFINLHPVNFRWQLLGRLFRQSSAFGGDGSLCFLRLQRGRRSILSGRNLNFCYRNFVFI